MPEFLQSPAGRAVIGVAVAVLAILIIELNYRWFSKPFSTRYSRL